MSSDNKNNNNGAQNNDEVASILKRLSELLDNSVSLDDAIALAKKQKEEEAAANASEELPTVTENKKKTSKEDGQLSFDLTADDADTDDNIAAEEQVEDAPVTEELAVAVDEQSEDAPVAEELAVAVDEQSEEIIIVSETEDVVIVETAEEAVEENIGGESSEENSLLESLEETDTAENSASKAILPDFEELLKALDEANEEKAEEEAPAAVQETDVEIIAVEESIADTVSPPNEPAVTEETAETEEITVKEKIEETVSEENSNLTVTNNEGTETAVAEEADSPAAEQTEEAPQTETSKIFDELMACFDDRVPFAPIASAEKAKETPAETTPADTSVSEEDKPVSEEDGETAYDFEEAEDGQGGDPGFVPVEHDIDKEDDDLFSAIFSEEKSERKNRENDKKRWQKQNDNGTAFIFGLFDWLEVIVLSAAFALLLFTFVLRLAVVDGDSMNHTLHDKELLIISDLMYTPENNDIIVFNSPNYPEPIVKRVIATEGQTVDIDFETWTVTVDGVALDEDYVNKVYGSMDKSDTEFPLTVPEGHVFVMGDNRNESLDSRNSRIGFVDVRYILGEVKIRLFPFNRFGKVN